MGSIISSNQSALIRNGLSTNEVVFINEVVDLARKSDKKYTVFKVDFEKR